MSKEELELNVIECHWGDVRSSVQKYEPELCAIIDKLSPSKAYPIFKATYPFGAKIFENGIFRLPTKDKEKDTIAVTDSSIPVKLQRQLTYSDLPLGMVMDYGAEIYAELENGIFPVAYVKHGLHFGIWETFAPATPLTITAGARSMFMLPKISDAERYRRLNNYGVGFSIPFTPFDQWKTFVKLANHKNFPEPWQCEVIFFSAPWMEKIKKDPAWSSFHFFVMQRLWSHTCYGHNKLMLDIAWDAFSNLLTKRRMKPNTYLIDTVKHLTFIAEGIIPAFAPAVDNQAAPIDGLLKIYLDEYGLETYAPSLMIPHHFSLNTPSDYVYYSLQVPTYLESIPQSRIPTSTRASMVELIDLMDMFLCELLHGNLKSSSTYNVHSKLNHVQFDCFHSDDILEHGIYPSSDLPKEDKRLLYMPGERQKRKFCDKSTFARGCVRISNKFLGS